MKTILVLAILLAAPAAFADSGEGSAHSEDGTEIVFPVWTYWVEIFEHLAMLAISIAAIFLLGLKKSKRFKEARIAIAGLAILALSEFLTTLHHFLFYPFGAWNSIINHGLLAAGIALIAFALVWGFRND